MILSNSKVSYIEELARELVDSILFDTYDLMDTVYDSHDWHENAVSEMEATLWDDKQRKGLLTDIKGMIENCREEDAEELYALYAKIKEV